MLFTLTVPVRIYTCNLAITRDRSPMIGPTWGMLSSVAGVEDSYNRKTYQYH